MDENANGGTEGFDLFVEPWITCVSNTGEARDYGIESLLRDAHELGEIVDPSPLVTVSVLRLLEAVLIWSLKIDDEDRWYELWTKGRFDEEAMARVAECCSGRMDLFDPERPFYQSSDIDLTGRGDDVKNIKSIGYLFAEAATGVNVVHYNHTAEDDHAYCDVCSAKGLVTLSAFASAGGPGIRPSIPGSSPLYVVPLGDSVFRTLLLNCPLGSFRSPTSTPVDPGPFWLTGRSVLYKEERASSGFVESLTWQPRRLRLVPNGRPGRCTRCGRWSDRLTRQTVYRQGWFMSRQAPPWVDSWIAYRWDDKQVPHAVHVRRERQTWRDLEALFLSAAAAVSPDRRGLPARPGIVSQTTHLAHLLESPLHELCFVAAGLRADKDKVFECRSDRFEFPRVALGEDTSPALAQALREAETAAQCLRSALLHLHPAMSRRKPKKLAEARKATAMIALIAERGYWTDLESTFRERLFDERLLAVETREAWSADWRRQVLHAVNEASEAILASSDDTAEGLCRQEMVRRVLKTGLNRGGLHVTSDFRNNAD